MPIEQEQRINEKINSVLVLDEKYYKVENQSEVGCFYFPDPQPGVPVIFPGQCDETINVVQTLDLSEASHCFTIKNHNWFCTTDNNTILSYFLKPMNSKNKQKNKSYLTRALVI